MTADRNPQAQQMADESMLRNLEAQATAIWPQERRLFERYHSPARIADVGCGSGEITSRLAALYPTARLVGVDILESTVELARRRHSALAPRVSFVVGDAFRLSFERDELDLVVCRHLTQAVPEPHKVLEELARVCRPGGWLHVLSEDYSMLHIPGARLDPDRLWREGVGVFARATGTDERIGRKTWSILRGLGLTELTVDYVTVDTLRVPREIFAAIIRAWRDGYADAIAAHAALSNDEVRGLFDEAIATILDVDQYAVWQVPIISGRKPGRS